MENYFYRNIPKLSGIYCYNNLINGKKYIGQAVNLRKRIVGHEQNFKRDDNEFKENSYLWRSIRKYGRDNFSVQILLFCELYELDRYEINVIKIYDSLYNAKGYNISTGGNSPMRGRKHKPESIELIRIKNSGENNGNYGKRGAETSMFGKSQSDYQKEMMKIKMIGNTNCSGLFGEDNPMYGKNGKDHPNFGLKLGNSSSQYYGVYFNSRKGNGKRWLAKIWLNKCLIHIGTFRLESDAAKAYNFYVLENSLDNPLNIVE